MSSRGINPSPNKEVPEKGVRGVRGEGSGLHGLLPKSLGANIKELQICREANFRVVKHSF